jgi:hypothetical protein
MSLPVQRQEHRWGKYFQSSLTVHHPGKFLDHNIFCFPLLCSWLTSHSQPGTEEPGRSKHRQCPMKKHQCMLNNTETIFYLLDVIKKLCSTIMGDVLPHPSNVYQLFTLPHKPWHNTKANPLPPVFVLGNLWTALNRSVFYLIKCIINFFIH